MLLRLRTVPALIHSYLYAKTDICWQKSADACFLIFCCFDGVTKRYGTSRKARRAAARHSRIQRVWDAAQQADYGEVGTTLHCLPNFDELVFIVQISSDQH